MRPDRADVVADRVVAAIVGRERADAPAREHRVRHELTGDEPRALLGNDARPEQVPHVRGHRVDPALVAVEADDVVAAALVGPEVVVEARVQLLGLALEPLGELDVGAEPPRELGDAQLRVVDVALDLGGRDRQVRDRSVGELDAVPRVLPALVAEPLPATASGTRRSRRRHDRRTGRSRRARRRPCPSAPERTRPRR